MGAGRHEKVVGSNDPDGELMVMQWVTGGFLNKAFL